MGRCSQRGSRRARLPHRTAASLSEVGRPGRIVRPDPGARRHRVGRMDLVPGRQTRESDGGLHRGAGTSAGEPHSTGRDNNTGRGSECRGTERPEPRGQRSGGSTGNAGCFDEQAGDYGNQKDQSRERRRLAQSHGPRGASQGTGDRKLRSVPCGTGDGLAHNESSTHSRRAIKAGGPGGQGHEHYASVIPLHGRPCGRVGHRRDSYVGPSRKRGAFRYSDPIDPRNR